MNTLQRSSVSFRRQGSSGRVYDLRIEPKSGPLAGFSGPTSPTTGRSQELNPGNRYRFTIGGEGSMHEKGVNGHSSSHRPRNQEKRPGIFSCFRICRQPSPRA